MIFPNIRGQGGIVYEYHDGRQILSPKKQDRKGKPFEPYDIRVKRQCVRDYGWTAALYIALLMERFGSSETGGFYE
ncbi:MAG: hypothetical protein BGN88_10265 [Clostridiales bacterium 43-6]|nr:MAG: hypothetical protein BGN88_10265 [Clostridiales bacterium 43-6]